MNIGDIKKESNKVLFDAYKALQDYIAYLEGEETKTNEVANTNTKSK